MVKIDLTCPAEVWRCELPREGFAACALTLYNLTDKLISSVEVTLLLLDQSGEEQTRLIYRAHDLHGAPAKTFQVTVPVEGEAAPAAAEAVVEKIWYDDSSVWRRGKNGLREYTPNALPSGRELERLRDVAGSTAVGFPEEQNGLWLCVCGRPNGQETEECVRCHRSRRAVFEQYSREQIDRLVDEREQALSETSRAAREEASKLQLAREQEYERRRKKRRRAAVCAAAAVVCAGAVWAGVTYGLPYLRYRQAVSALEDGRYAEAQAAFADMGEYRDAADFLRKSRYLAAQEQLESGDEARITTARSVFEALGDYEGAAERVRECDYLLAGLRLEAGDIEAASALYTALGDYRDSAAQVTNCAYQAADKLLRSARYEEARAAFEALGDYSDAAEKAKQAVYLPGRAAVTEDPDAAIALLGQLPGYEDADALLQQAYYRRGVALRDAGSLEEAGAAFRQAGDYEDAAAQVNACLYAPAVDAMAAKDYARARALLAQILPYEDATARWQTCTYQLALTAMKDTEYAQARTLLAELPEDYEDVAVKRQESWYQPALAAAARGDYQQALDYFAQVPDYRDSAKETNKARANLAEALREAGDYAGAIAQYELLGESEDVRKQLKLTRYEQAAALVESGSYAEAEALLTELDGYKDSETLLKKARYGMAEALQSSGDIAGARALFDSLGKYADAKERVQACDLLIASALETTGKLEEAAAGYEALGDYGDAASKAQEAYYALGEQAEQTGDALLAAEYFRQAGAYSDASARMDAAYDAAYAEPNANAHAAYDAGDYAGVLAALADVSLTALPEKYADLATISDEANYQLGVQRADAGDVYGALPYFRLIPTYQDVPERLARSCYMILGQWEDQDGRPYEFREDGTCVLAGEPGCFAVTGYSMETGATLDALTATHRVTEVTADRAILRDVRLDAQAQTIYLTRTLESLPLPDTFRVEE